MGGQVFMEGATSNRFAFALATSLTTVCRLLDVELVLDHDTGAQPYWGQTGHYSIAAFACSSLSTAKLRTFMLDNLDSISFTTANLTAKEIAKRLKTARDEGGLIPLADVPDLVWKQHFSKMVGGRDTQFVDLNQLPEDRNPRCDTTAAHVARCFDRRCSFDPSNRPCIFGERS